MNLLDGNAGLMAIKQELKEEVTKRSQIGLKIPHLAAVLVGADGASQTYVSSKVRDCADVGFGSTLIQLPADVTAKELRKTIDDLNTRDVIDGYIVQLPLPAHLDEREITLSVDPMKDVDGFHPENVGRMNLGLPCYLPATPNGIVELLKRNNVDTEGRHCLVLGRSNIVGTPMAILMSRNANPGNCTVTLAHSRTRQLTDLCLSADILIAALGKPLFVKADMVKEGAVVIDVGITRVPDATRKSGYRLAGDVDFEEVAPRCAWITPVPGGVGPMTRASLLQNTLKACRRRTEH
ncbi:MAG: bifunctional 5,10-methylene-tetrahydrofolate dehydrogenase/5,10-methylene-tetrahydrofolate cyclohydrolase [Flavobacteriales bacterium]|nr:bifunctional 5,10-methylene-tetrahydrofolate dehydrogenase/5,10-methylene-tetrahydrofolate cyclohydrolase [Flavobacteriales bacterium]